MGMTKYLHSKHYQSLMHIIPISTTFSHTKRDLSLEQVRNPAETRIVQVLPPTVSVPD